MKIQNSKGNVYYGLHFYEGPCQYNDPKEKKSYKVCLKEPVLREMDQTFAGRPVFVEHVAGVDSDLDELRKEADGWVVESFFNQADGKHWVKFIVVSEKGEKAVADGMKLSNCYVAKRFGPGSQWNAIPYEREILEAEFEHLAIVPDPRYQESVIMTPDEFKAYNEDNLRETEKYANGAANEENEFMFFTKTKVDKSKELEGLLVTLPKSKVEIEVIKMINAADEWEIKKKEPQMADMSHQVELKNGEKCTVGELMEKHNAMCNELEAMKSKKEENDDEGEDDEDMDNSGDDDKESSLKLAEDKEKEIAEEKKQNDIAVKKAEKDLAREKAERLKNAGHGKDVEKPQRLEMSGDRVARGKARYGS